VKTKFKNGATVTFYFLDVKGKIKSPYYELF